MGRNGLEPPPDNKGRVDAANKALWKQHRDQRDAQGKKEKAEREKRNAEREDRDNHRLNREAQAERDAVQKQAAKERHLACKEMARKRKEAKQAAADAASQGGLQGIGDKAQASS